MTKLLRVSKILVLGCVANAATFVLATQAGCLGSSVVVASNGAPLTVAPVLWATLVGALAAVMFRRVLGRLLPAGSARRVFLGLSGVVLLLSFASPAAGLEGETAMDVVVLDLLHVVAAVTAVLAAEWAARPRWDFGARPYVERRIVPPTAVVTGATSGIGASVAVELSRRGYRVIGIGRDAEKASRISKDNPSIEMIVGDLSSLREARRIAEDVNRITAPEGAGILVHCAGVLVTAPTSTEDGIDVNFATSFLGRFVLTESLSLADGCRLVNVAAAERGEVPASMRTSLASPGDVGRGIRAHGHAQIANDLWVAALARRGWSAYGYGPGAVDTSIRRELPAVIRGGLRPLFAVDTRAPHEAALDIVRLLLDTALPSSGFASRHGLFEHDAFIRNAERQDALVKLAHSLSETYRSDGVTEQAS